MILHEKLVEIRKLVKALKKDTVGKVGFKDYPYISTDNILEKIMDKMNELKVLLIPTLSDCTLREFNYVNKDGKDKTDFITQGTMGFTWVNAEDPADREHVPWYFFGQQDEASKSLGSGLTYSQRYFLKMSFLIATDEDDPDLKDTSGKLGKPTQKDKPDYPECLSGKPERDDKDDSVHLCHDCGNEIKETKKKTREQILADGIKYHKLELCQPCLNIRYKAAHPDV
jgi:hypothetical protein